MKTSMADITKIRIVIQMQVVEVVVQIQVVEAVQIDNISMFYIVMNIRNRLCNYDSKTWNPSSANALCNCDN